MKTIQVSLIFLFAAISLHAQPREGTNKELSFSGSYQNYSSEGTSSSTSAILISDRLGFFVVEGLELEPEILLMIQSAGDPIYVLNGNVAWNFISKGKGMPFLLVGYGRANTIPIFNVPIAHTGFGVNVLNIGGGVKVFLKEDIAMRLEYRFQKFSGQGATYNFGYGSFTEEVNVRIHSVQFGISIML